MDMHNVGRNLAAILGGKRHIAYREQYEIYLVVRVLDTSASN